MTLNNVLFTLLHNDTVSVTVGLKLNTQGKWTPAHYITYVDTASPPDIITFNPQPQPLKVESMFLCFVYTLRSC